jgi:outer membrane protease
VILPAAQRYLTDEDWIAMRAFEQQRSAHSDTDMQYRRLFSRIVNLAAEPQ